MLPKDAVTNALSIHDLRAFFPHASPQRILKYGGVLLDSIGRANRWGNSTFPAYCIATIAAETSNFNPSAPEGLTLPEDGVRYPNTLTETRPFGSSTLEFSTEARNWQWARVAVWDVAGNGAFINPVRR